MKFSRLYLSVLVSLSMSSFSTYAMTDNDKTLLTQMNQRMSELQKQVSGLQGEVKVLKTELRHEKSKNKTEPTATPVRYTNKKTTSKKHSQSGETTQGPVPSNSAVSQPDPTQYHIMDALLGYSTPVFSSPYIGINSSFDGSDLIINQSSVNLDYRLLKQKQFFFQNLQQAGVPVPTHPVIELSGKLEAQAYYNRPQPGSNDNAIDLTSAYLDAFINLNQYVSGFLDLTYDNSPTSPIRVGNSRIFLRQGFMTLGNMEKTPFYASMGQMFVPFGQYNGSLVSLPTTLILGRARERALVLGYRPDEGIYANAYLFKGDIDIGGETQGGGTLGFKKTFGDWKTELSTGVISNLAESDGMQSTNPPASIPFAGFGQSIESEKLVHSVPGLDVNGSLGYGNYTLYAEYVRALRRFDVIDMTYNTLGAEPQALHTEGVYSFTICGKPSSLALGFDFTKQALALMLPRERLSATLNYSPWRDTVASLEYRHDFEYNNGVYASGANGPAFNMPENKDDTVTLQFGVYF